MKKYLVNITDCVDIAANELHAVLSQETDGTENLVVTPIVPISPAFSITNTNFAVRLMADAYPKNSVLMTTINGEKVRPMNVIGRTKDRDIIFIGRNMGSFDWLTRDFGCAELYDLTRHNKSGFVSFAGKYTTAKIAAAAANGVELSDLGDPIDPQSIVRLELEMGTIVHIDNFGMMKFVGDIGSVMANDRFDVSIGNRTFQAVYEPRLMSRETGEWVLFPGSSFGLFELGQTRKLGAHDVGINVGDVIKLQKL